ncbi:hypothetical protein CFC21_058203 [Triticum aestivum]|uniref:No apical meristem-associated C-terminal domain-containing protein n=3 Tax=Triticum TaxID=4564 RepID=A0A9R0T5Q2_TRITD|nr:hypothetical protein CFC21_058203 [Triticum aestivum]VAI07695.1 unnamed protein product [Triticum turgidum subsp. durum]
MDDQSYFDLLHSDAGLNDLHWTEEQHVDLEGHVEQEIDLQGHEEQQTDLEETEEPTPVKARSSKAKPKKASASKRQKNFSKAEDLTLVDAYLEITQDPIIGVDQSRDCYWKRIDAYFHANKSEDHGRTQGSLQHRWAIIQEQVNRFCACYSQVQNRNQSGMTRENKLFLRKGHLESRGLKMQHGGLKVLPVQREEDRLVEERKKLAIQEKKMELEEEKIRIMRMAEERMMGAEESKIMSMDLSGMDEQEQEFYKLRKSQIINRHRNSSA